MEIDLTQLNDLFNAPCSDLNKEGNTITPPKGQPSQGGYTEPLERIDTTEQPKKYMRIEKDKEIQENSIKAYKEYQGNIKNSGMLRADILKDIKLGKDPYNLLLKAIKCISLMTGDKHYYNQAKEDLQTIYKSLGYKAPAEQEVQEVQGGLNKLKEALEQEVDPRNRQRIKGAIKAHKQREYYLLKLIS